MGGGGRPRVKVVDLKCRTKFERAAEVSYKRLQTCLMDKTAPPGQAAVSTLSASRPSALTSLRELKTMCEFPFSFLLLACSPLNREPVTYRHRDRSQQLADRCQPSSSPRLEAWPSCRHLLWQAYGVECQVCLVKTLASTVPTNRRNRTFLQPRAETTADPKVLVSVARVGKRSTLSLLLPFCSSSKKTLHGTTPVGEPLPYCCPPTSVITDCS